jgi:hypothetical protein
MSTNRSLKTLFSLVLIAMLVLTLSPGVALCQEGPAQGYEHNWDENPYAYIPESTMAAPTGIAEQPQQYAQDWDENPVAYVPESTMTVSAGQPQQYAQDWDENPVAYVPESTMQPCTLIDHLRECTKGWGDNLVDCIPESTMTGLAVGR